MKLIVIPIVVDALGMTPKGLEKKLGKLEIRGGITIIQTSVLLKSARILRRVLETRGELLSLRFQRKTISEIWCQNSLRVKIQALLQKYRLRDTHLRSTPL